MTLSEVAGRVPISGWSHVDKIKFFAWFLHSQEHKARFVGADILRCYDSLRLDKPSNVYQTLKELEARRPRQVLKDSKGYYLERATEERLQKAHGERSITVEMTQLLLELPSQVPNVAEREFLKETLICYTYGAFRATIVMVWNLAFDHLLDYILKHHLTKFNTQWPVRFPKHHKAARIPMVSDKDHFEVFKESEVLEICKSAAIITSDVYKIMAEKLDKRNTAAHPSTVAVTQIQAESAIDDLVRNVVLTLKI
jgi:hypothetical protein